MGWCKTNRQTENWPRCRIISSNRSQDKDETRGSGHGWLTRSWEKYRGCKETKERRKKEVRRDCQLRGDGEGLAHPERAFYCFNVDHADIWWDLISLRQRNLWPSLKTYQLYHNNISWSLQMASYTRNPFSSPHSSRAVRLQLAGPLVLSGSLSGASRRWRWLLGCCGGRTPAAHCHIGHTSPWVAIRTAI